MKKIILYARVSTQKQSTHGDSLNTQIADMRKYAEIMKWEVIREFEEQFTGTKDNRPALNKAIEYIKDLRKEWIQIDYLLVSKIDRNTRGWMEVHNKIKEKLKAVWVQLKDSQGIIQDEISAVNIDWVDTSCYDWAQHNPSESSETFMAMSAQQERKSILQRTISQEIRMAYEWYWVKPPNIGFDNKSVITHAWTRRTIQVPHYIESKWFICMFQMAADGYSDKDIVGAINLLWFKTRIQTLWDSSKTKAIWEKGGNILDIKKLQAYIQKPIYAWVSPVTWWNNPTKLVLQKYPWLVTVDLWNRANRWKRLLVIENGQPRLLEWKDFQELPDKKRRLKNNPKYPFSNLVFAQNSVKYLNGNAPKGRTGKRYDYYSTTVNKKNESYKQEYFESEIIKYLTELKIDNEGWLNLFMELLDSIWEERKIELNSYNTNLAKELSRLRFEEKRIIQEVSAFINYPEILRAKDEELKDIGTKIINIESQLWKDENTVSLDGIKTHWKKLIENIGKIASNTRDHEILKFLFRFTFTETPEFVSIVNRNTPLQAFFAIGSQQKILHEGEFPKNMIWQLHSESNWGSRLWRPMF